MCQKGDVMAECIVCKSIIGLTKEIGQLYDSSVTYGSTRIKLKWQKLDLNPRLQE